RFSLPEDRANSKTNPWIRLFALALLRFAAGLDRIILPLKADFWGRILVRSMWNVASLILGFVGSALAFLDSVRTASRLPEDGITLAYDPRLQHWFWRRCGTFGFGLLTVAFAIQVLIALAGSK